MAQPPYPSVPDEPVTRLSEPSASVAGVDRFAHFVINRRDDGELDYLGRGAMGLTYRAFDTQLERPVALKVINPDRLHDAEVRSRFSREARAAARLQHPNIANVLFQGAEGPMCFYVMELVAGEDLHHYIHRVGPISPVHALRMAHPIALALDAAYREDILHRDLKPSNVMLTSYHEGGAPHVKVIDFGLAKLITENSTSFMTSGFLGTPEFASPEQCEEKELDSRSDLYSLGATLWFLLTGRAPFSGSLISVIQKHVSAPPPFEMIPNAPQALLVILRRLLAKDPDDRPATPLAAAQEIEHAIAILAKDPKNFEPLIAAPAIADDQKATQASRSVSGSKVRVATKSVLPLVKGVLTLGGVMGAAWFGASLVKHKPGEPTGAVRGPEPVASVSTPTATTAPVTSGGFSPPSLPARDGEYVNSLGMKFIPVSGLNVRYAVWETRVRDFEVFANETKFTQETGTVGAERQWRNPGFAQTPDDPVVNVSWEEARRFCQWLTDRERATGKLQAAQSYRLPSRFEWDGAAGHPPPHMGTGFGGAGGGQRGPGGAGGGPDGRGGPNGPDGQRPPEGRFGPPGGAPQGGGAQQGGGLPGGGPPYNWGTHQWPPYPGSGNYADVAALNAKAVSAVIDGYSDGFAHTAPVGRFIAARTGLFDMSGNVWEICQDSGIIGMQGGGWASASQSHFRMHELVTLQPKQREPFLGFRLVLE